MSGETIADIEVGKKDDMGLDILMVYHKVDRIYTIYANVDRMVVKYSNDEKFASEQRLALSHLAPLRGEINGLIDGWREGSPFRHEKDVKAPGAGAALRPSRCRCPCRRVTGRSGWRRTRAAAINQDIIEERVSLGRVQYVLAAGILAFAIFLFFGAMHHLHFPFFVRDNDVWLATGLGCLGAFFSIAIAT